MRLLKNKVEKALEVLVKSAPSDHFFLENAKKDRIQGHILYT